jgi:hypothetical protein
MIHCLKCSGKMFVDRIFTTNNYLEMYCIICGKREMYVHPDNHGKRAKWAINLERLRAKKSGHSL